MSTQPRSRPVIGQPRRRNWRWHGQAPDHRRRPTPYAYRPANSVHGWDLRALLTLALFDAGRPLTVPELVGSITGRGLAIWGRPSKVVSDAMRAEIYKGRVRRVSRGCYAADTISRSTRYRFRKRAVAALALADTTG